MGKIRTKIIGDEEVEKKQVIDAELRKEKKTEKKKLSETLKASLDSAIESEKLEEVNTKEDIESVKEEKKSKKDAKSKKSTIKKRVIGKNHKKALSQINNKEKMTIEKAIEMIKKSAYAKFDESIELHISVLETGLRGEVMLPHGTGKTVNVVVLDDNVLADIDAGKTNFDILVATPSQMPKLAKYAKILGPKGLMPNPKTGTVTEKPEEAVKKFSSGVTRYKTEPKFPLVHITVGKISFGDSDLKENIDALINSIGKKNIKNTHLCATMGPSVLLDLGEN